MPDSGSLYKSTAPVRDADLANAIRALAMDAVEAAKSGHPGMPMGMAEIAVALWSRHLRHNPANPHWPDRDRFVLSNGHGSMLQYALLHLTGYDLPIDELRRFRQLGSKTPGHPEVGVTAGVETTTGPLGQGLANAVGMALAERLLAQTFNRPGHAIVDRVAGGEHQDRQLAPFLADPARDVQPGDVRQADVEDHDIDAVLAERDVQPGLAVRRDLDVVTVLLEEPRQRATESRIVLDEEDLHAGW
jgi:hypothetical protein